MIPNDLHPTYTRLITLAAMGATLIQLAGYDPNAKDLPPVEIVLRALRSQPITPPGPCSPLAGCTCPPAPTED